MATATGRFVNFSGVTFTPSGGTAIPITEVQDIDFDPGAQLLNASGDADIYNTAVTLISMGPRVTITTQALAALIAITPGVKGTLVYIIHDFYNGTGTGAITYTISNCVVASPRQTSRHRQTSTGTLNFEAYSADGQTSPVATSIAA